MQHYNEHKLHLIKKAEEQRLKKPTITSEEALKQIKENSK